MYDLIPDERDGTRFDIVYDALKNGVPLTKLGQLITTDDRVSIQATPIDYVAEMRELVRKVDSRPETDMDTSREHRAADEILCEALIASGQKELVEEYHKLKRSFDYSTDGGVFS